MITEIGIVAGDIWHFLDNRRTCTLDELVKGIDKNRNVVLMSLGWLAREGHIILDQEGPESYKITLRF